MSIGRIYYASFKGISHTVITDLFFIEAPTDALVLIHEIKITNRDQETSEQLPIELFRTTTANAAAGTGVTPAPRNVGDPAFGGTVRRLITGGSLAAATTDLLSHGENVLNGWHWLPTPDGQLVLSPVAATGGRLNVKLAVAPAAAILLDGYVLLEEIGG